MKKNNKKNPTVSVELSGKKLEIEEKDILKYEIADELDLLDTVIATGWRSLSAKETGRIGGIMSRRKNAQETKMKKNDK